MKKSFSMLMILVLLLATSVFAGVEKDKMTFTNEITITGEIQGATPLVLEGATKNVYETSIAVTDPTADRTITIPDATGTLAIILGTGASVSIPSTLATNGVDVANSVWGGTNQIIMEGATADVHETIITPTDATADRTLTTPDATGTIMLSTAGPELSGGLFQSGQDLKYEGTTVDAFEGIIRFPADAAADYILVLPSTSGYPLLSITDLQGAHGIWTGNSSFIFEGATVNAFETTLTVTDPTAVRTITLPDVTGTVVTTGDTGSVTSTMLAEGTIQYAAVEISSAEILALFTTPKALVAAPGAGKVLEFVSLLLAYDYGTVVYTIGTAGNLQVKYTDGSGAATSTTQAVTGMIDQATDQLRAPDKLEASITPVVNAALVLTLATANPTAGDGTIHAKVLYRVLSTGL